MPDIVPKSPAEPMPLEPRLSPEVQDWVSELQRLWAAAGLSINRFVLLHPMINKGTVSRYLRGERVPRDRWFLDTLLAIQADNGKPVTPNVREYLIELHLGALQAAHPHEYRVRRVLDELEIAHTGLVRAELYARDLGEKLAERKRQIEELIDETGRLRAAWDADRVAMQAEYERLVEETDKIAEQLHLARERADRAERLCQQLEVELERLDAGTSADNSGDYHDEVPSNHHDQERDLLIASMDELAPDDRRHVASLVESLRMASVAQLDRPGRANGAIDGTGQRAINPKGANPD
jgi:hypothetical protein